MKGQILGSNDNASSLIINKLKDLLTMRGDEVDSWFEAISRNTPPFFYNSVDLRHSGYKLAPVDTNLFPAGFNNLNSFERDKAISLVPNFLGNYYQKVKNILLITEDHTRNSFYLENVAVLAGIIKDAGFNLRLSSISTSTMDGPVELTTNSGSKLILEPLQKNDGIISIKDGFVPDFILLNNDLTSGVPDLLKDVRQIVSPPVEFGWHMRRKSLHFEAYDNMSRDFAHVFGIDPWLISTFSARCGVVNFKEKLGLECVATQVDKLITKITEKYKEYGVEQTPYVFIKSDMGTYGMGIMTARSGTEVLAMGKDIRKKMNIIKGGTQNTEVIIQEGVPTIDKVGEFTAEPMIYMIGGEPVGCIYRTNSIKDSYENLNAAGMGFTSMCEQNSDRKLCSAFGLIAKLAAYSAAWECYVESYSI